MRFYSYDFKDETKNTIKAKIKSAANTEEKPKTHINFGVMADEAPSEIQSSDGKGIDMYSYIGLVAKSVQELTETVKEQQKYIEKLKKKIAELKK